MEIEVLWGKSDSQGAAYPLYAHMVDAGRVAQAILNSPQHRRLLVLLEQLSGLDRDDIPQFVPFLVALHDIGKAAPGFQRKVAELWRPVRAAGFPDAGPLWRFVSEFRHDVESYGSLREYLLADWIAAVDQPGDVIQRRRQQRTLIRTIAQAVGAHHGSFVSEAEVSAGGYPQVGCDHAEDGCSTWAAARRQLIDYLAATFGVSTPAQFRTPELSALALALNGLTILSDWIASNEAFFPPLLTDLARHPEKSAMRAQAAIAQVGLLRYPAASMTASFSTLFPHLEPRPVQVAVDGLGHGKQPLLTVIEAPTGEGKTEAALLLAEQLIGETSGGLYFALPTMATSNQIFRRVHDFLETTHPGDEAGLMLVHSQASMTQGFSDLLQRQPSNDETGVGVVDAWFLPRKRALLAPFGVGTIDQCLLAALRVRHGSLRLFGLAGKVVIVDEVHAYDAYMSAILERLLCWLAAMRVSVILLSATLTARMRQRLAQAYGAQAETQAPMAYPLLTLAQPGQPVTFEEPASSQTGKLVQLHLAEQHDRENVLSSAVAAALEGGAVGWVCDTVGSSQATYRAVGHLLQGVPDAERPELVLYHARMLLKDRGRVEARVEDLVGKESARARGCIVVATQVVEQSLDIDFDLLVTELAPIDLLLQRIGRLHRHERSRPEGLRETRCTVLVPEIARDTPSWSGIDAVYSPFVLIKTMLALHDRDAISIPDEVRALVERVYDDQLLSGAECELLGLEPEVVLEARVRLTAARESAEAAARMFLLAQPQPDRFQGGESSVITLRGDDDDELLERDQVMGAQTRLAEPSARVILLEQDHRLCAADSQLWQDGRLSLQTTRLLVDHSVAISHWALVPHTLELDAPPSFQRTAALRGMTLLMMKDGEYEWAHRGRTFRLHVDATLGVEIEQVR